MHENIYTKHNDGVDLRSEVRSVGSLHSKVRVPGGVELGEDPRGFRLLINPSMDARSHGVLEREFFAYHPDDREAVLADYAQMFPSALFVPDNHLFLIVGGKPKFGLVEDAIPIMNKEFILRDDPNVIGFHSNMMGGDDTADAFFEYYIGQEETSYVQDDTRVMALITVGIRLATNDFGSINEEIKRLVRAGVASEAKIRELIDPYMRVQLRAVPIKNDNEDGGEGVSIPRIPSPQNPDGQFAYADEDIL